MGPRFYTCGGGPGFIPVGGPGFSLQAPDDFISTVYIFFHTATDLETLLDSLELIEVETVDPFEDDENGEFHVAEIVLE